MMHVSDFAMFAASLSLTAAAVMGVDVARVRLATDHPEDYLVVRSIEARQEGGEILLSVDRDIKQDFIGRWSVIGRQSLPDGWQIVCDAAAPSWRDYKAGNILPDPMTLDYWTFGQCVSLPKGTNEICTTWTIKGQSEHVVRYCTKPFEVTE